MARPPTTHSFASNPVQVLLVENNATHTRLIQRAFSSLAVEIKVVRDLHQAQRQLQQFEPDLIIADWRLPDGSGAAFLAASEQEPIRYPVILMTSQSDEQAAVEAIKAGALDYVVKTEATLLDMPYIVVRALREWGHIVERRRAEALLRLNEERYQLAVSGTRDGLWDWDMVTNTIWYSPVWWDIIGYNDEADQRNYLWSAHVHPDDLPYAHGAMSHHFNGTNTVYLYSYRHRHKDGRWLWIEARGTCVRNAAGRPIRFTGRLTDISERKRTEQALHDSEEKYRQIFTTETDAILLYSATTLQILDANPAAARLYGYQHQELLGLNVAVLTAEPEKTLASIERIIAGERVYTPLRHHRRKNGTEIDVEISSVSFTLHEQLVVCSIVRDIGDRLRTEAARQASEERFRDFAETAADWFWEMGPDLRFIYLSERYQTVTGIVPINHLGLSQHEIFRDQPLPLEQSPLGKVDFAAGKAFDVEFSWQRPDGKTRMLRIGGKALYDSQGVFSGYRGTGRDVTEAHQLAAQLTYQASHDALTGLVNRREFERCLEQLLAYTRHEDSEHALCFIDLDQFKVINDTCGHAAGDALLRQLGALLKARVRQNDTVARLGGDEFGLLIRHCPLEQAERIVQSLQQVFEDFRFLWKERRFNVGASIGLVAINSASESSAALLSAADAACYMAKESGRNRIHIYREDSLDLRRRHGEMQWVARIQEALEEGRFKLGAQPIAGLCAGDSGLHYELLLRMEDETGRLVMPGAFLAAAERYNLAGRLDRWVVRTALDWLAARPDHLQRLFLCSINLSGQTLGSQDVLDFIGRALDETGVPAHKICFEITETAAIANLANAIQFIKTLSARGCRFALDDFGSGLSSFGYLKNLPVDFLKIDGAFVRDIVEDSIDYAMVKSINEIGHVMGKRTIAEFVENAAILEKLRELGVDYVQGNHIGRPHLLPGMLARADRAD